MVVELDRRLFTVEEFQRMAEAGVFGEDERVELLDGEILTMSPVGDRHASCVKRLNVTLIELLGRTVVVGVQDPVELRGRSRLQPDLSVLRPRADFYGSGAPGPDDILLLIEVSDTTQSRDRLRKGPAYAAAGVPEYWLVDLAAELVEVYTQPGPDGYQHVSKLGRGETARAAGVEGLALAVDEILGHVPAPEA